MTPERENLIREKWREVRGHAQWGRYPELHVPVILPRPPTAIWEESPGAVADRLVFRRERGTMWGHPWERITCEGLVLEQGAHRAPPT